MRPDWKHYAKIGGEPGCPTLTIVRLTEPKQGADRKEILLMVEDFSFYQPSIGAREWNFFYRVIVADADNGVWLSRDDYATKRGADKKFNQILKEGFNEKGFE